MLDRELRLCDTAFAEEGQNLLSSGVLRCCGDRVEEVGRRRVRTLLFGCALECISAGPLQCEDEMTYAVTDEAKTSAAEELDELGVEFVISIPRASCHLFRWLKMIEHVNLPRRVLVVRRGFD